MKSKYKELTYKYSLNINNFLNNGNYDKLLLYEGISDFKDYLCGYFDLLVDGYIQDKNNLKKINQAILYRYGLYLGSKHFLKQEMSTLIDRISEDSIYYALGLESYKKRNFKYNKTTNFINHIKHNVFDIVLHDELKQIEGMLNNKSTYFSIADNSSEIFKELELLRAPQSIKSKIFKYLNGSLDFNKLNDIDIIYMKKISEKIL